MAVVTVAQWSTLRTALADWRTGRQNFSKEMVSLEGSYEISDHPLPMEELESTVGWGMLGGLSEFAGGFSSVDYTPAIVPKPVPFVPVVMTWLEAAYG